MRVTEYSTETIVDRLHGNYALELCEKPGRKRCAILWKTRFDPTYGNMRVVGEFVPLATARKALAIYIASLPQLPAVK